MESFLDINVRPTFPQISERSSQIFTITITVQNRLQPNSFIAS